MSFWTNAVRKKSRKMFEHLDPLEVIFRIFSGNTKCSQKFGKNVGPSSKLFFLNFLFFRAPGSYFSYIFNLFLEPHECPKKCLSTLTLDLLEGRFRNSGAKWFRKRHSRSLDFWSHLWPWPHLRGSRGRCGEPILPDLHAKRGSKHTKGDPVSNWLDQKWGSFSDPLSLLLLFSFLSRFFKSPFCRPLLPQRWSRRREAHRSRGLYTLQNF